MSKLAPNTDTMTDELLVEALEQLTGLKNPTATELHRYAASVGQRASDLVREAERVARDIDLDRRHLDAEIAKLRTVQDVARYAFTGHLDLSAVFARRLRMLQEGK